MARAIYAVVVALTFLAALTAASINNNPDTWELPPAAPNYGYWNQGLIGTGDLATLVTIRDPMSSSVAYNTSLFAFSVSGGLVPLNYIDLKDGHCQSYMINDVIICDFMSSAGGTTNFYQLTVNPGEGGANRLAVVAELSAPHKGAFASMATPVVTPWNTILMIQNQDPLVPGGDNVLNVWELNLASNTSDSTAEAASTPLELDLIGSWPGSNSPLSIGDSILSFALNSAGDQLVVLTFFRLSHATYQSIYSYPALELLSSTPATSMYYFGASPASATTGLTISQPELGPYTLLYNTFDLTSWTNTGASLNDTTSSYFSSGLFYGSSGGSLVPTTGPCLYVSAYANAQSKTQYALVSQVKYPTSGSQAASIEAQVSVPSTTMNTIVANDKYLFLITQEIMYRYPATC